MRSTRRDFIKTVVALGGMASLNGLMPIISAAAENAASPATGMSVKNIKTTCCYCVNYCGINVKTVNGTIRGIYPDPARATVFNNGICPMGSAGAFNAYNPYRLKVPLKRTNPNKGLKEDPRWVEISWEEAFSTIAARMNKIKKEDPAKVVWQTGHGQYLMNMNFMEAFFAAFESPNVVGRASECIASRFVAEGLTWGNISCLPDLDHTNMLLNFGSNYFEADQWARWLDYNVTKAKNRGMKVVVMDPRLSNSAGKADEWVPVRPGTDVVMILAMAKIMMDDGAIDIPFLNTYTNAPNLVDEDGLIINSDEGKPLVWDSTSNSARVFASGVTPTLTGTYTVQGKRVRTAYQVFVDSLKDITPEYAEEVCDIPAATITRLAREFAKAARIGSTITLNGQKLRYRPAAVYTFRGVTAKEFGVQNWRSGLILEMLIGGIDAVGGVQTYKPMSKGAFFETSKCEYPPKRMDLSQSIYYPYSFLGVAQQMQNSMHDPEAYGLNYKPEMQFFYATNRSFSCAEPQKQFETLSKTFNVVIELFMSETAWYGDIVLPDITYLESWHLSQTRWTVGATHHAIRQPVTNAYNLPHDGFSIIWELAKRTGIRDRYIEQLNEKWGLKENKLETGRDYTAREVVEILWHSKTKKDFGYALEHAFLGNHENTKERYLSGVESKFKGTDKPKMKFYADQLVTSMVKVQKTVTQHKIKNIDLANHKLAMSPLPVREHAKPSGHRVDNMPFYLITYKVSYRYHSGANISLNPVLRSLGKDATENYIVINRDTAIKMGIRDGTMLIVESRIGKVKGKARLTEGIRPDTVAISNSYGQWSPGLPEHTHKGMWINQALESNSDVISGMESYNDTKCKVYKV